MTASKALARWPWCEVGELDMEMEQVLSGSSIVEEAFLADGRLFLLRREARGSVLTRPEEFRVLRVEALFMLDDALEDM